MNRGLVARGTGGLALVGIGVALALGGSRVPWEHGSVWVDGAGSLLRSAGTALSTSPDRVQLGASPDAHDAPALAAPPADGTVEPDAKGDAAEGSVPPSDSVEVAAFEATPEPNDDTPGEVTGAAVQQGSAPSGGIDYASLNEELREMADALDRFNAKLREAMGGSRANGAPDRVKEAPQPQNESEDADAERLAGESS